MYALWFRASATEHQCSAALQSYCCSYMYAASWSLASLRKSNLFTASALRGNLIRNSRVFLAGILLIGNLLELVYILNSFWRLMTPMYSTCWYISTVLSVLTLSAFETQTRQPPGNQVLSAHFQTNLCVEWEYKTSWSVNNNIAVSPSQFKQRRQHDSTIFYTS